MEINLYPLCVYDRGSVKIENFYWFWGINLCRSLAKSLVYISGEKISIGKQKYFT